jgi:hypothetical protein
MGLTIRTLIAGARNRRVSSPKRPRRLRGPSSLLFIEYWHPFQGIKRPGRDVDHTSPSSGEIKKEWSHTSSHPIRLCGLDKDKFRFPCATYCNSNQHSFCPHTILWPRWTIIGGPGSSVAIVNDYGLDGPGSNPGGDEIFRPSRPALGPTQPPVK